EQGEDQHEDEPQGLGPAGQVTATENVDEYRDQDPEPDHPQEDHEDRPERAEQGVGMGTRGERHGVSLTCCPRRRPGGGPAANAMIVLVSCARVRPEPWNRLADVIPA